MLYPGYPWQSSRFLGTGKRTVRQGFWKDKENLFAALTSAEERLGIRQVLILLSLCCLLGVRKLGINQADMSPARGLVFSKYVGIEGARSTLPNEQAALGRAAPRKVSRLSMGKSISPQRAVCTTKTLGEYCIISI